MQMQHTQRPRRFLRHLLLVQRQPHSFQKVPSHMIQRQILPEGLIGIPPHLLPVRVVDDGLDLLGQQIHVQRIQTIGRVLLLRKLIRGRVNRGVYRHGPRNAQIRTQLAGEGCMRDQRVLRVKPIGAVQQVCFAQLIQQLTLHSPALFPHMTIQRALEPLHIGQTLHIQVKEDFLLAPMPVQLFQRLHQRRELCRGVNLSRKGNDEAFFIPLHLHGLLHREAQPHRLGPLAMVALLELLLHVFRGGNKALRPGKSLAVFLQHLGPGRFVKVMGIQPPFRRIPRLHHVGQSRRLRQGPRLQNNTLPLLHDP